MPRFPQISGPAGAMPSSIFARLVGRLESFQGETFPFHIGDTYLPPPADSRLEALCWSEKAAGRLYGYAAPAGDPALIDAVQAKLATKNGILAEVSQIQITAGATHAFACAMRALLDHGDEVLLLSPYWPLIRGQVLAVGARPVEVPFSQELYGNPNLDPRTLLEPFITPKTAAIYLITPNNPDGKVFDRRTLEAIAEVAERAKLWVLSDEVYEDFAFDGRTHLSMAALPRMAERTLTVFSFSKSYAQAGLRVGYIVGPERAVVPIRKLANHSIYNVPRAMQRAALVALEHGLPFLREARAEYRAARDETLVALAKLPIPLPTTEGGSYVFVDLSHYLRAEETALAVLETLAVNGILLAPGDAFGRAYAKCARLCYTAVPPGRLSAGLCKLVSILETVK